MWGSEMWGLVALGGGMAFISNVLYVWGGTEMSWGGKKWLRRYLGSFVLAASSSIIAWQLGVWSWKYLLMYPLISIGMSLGYGGDNVWTKIIKRTLFALGVCSACFIGLWATGYSGSGWLVFGLSVGTGLTSVALGVWNPFKNAPLEQFIISQVLTMYVPFWAFVN